MARSILFVVVVGCMWNKIEQWNFQLELHMNFSACIIYNRGYDAC